MGSKRNSLRSEDLFDLITAYAAQEVEIAQLKAALRRVGVPLRYSQETDPEDIDTAVREFLG